MNKIASIGNVLQKENEETKKVEEVPGFTLELHNRVREVNPEKDIDLQFDLSPASYENIFKKELHFESKEEMEACRKILDKIKNFDDKEIPYVVLNSPFTNSIMVLDDKFEGETVQYDNSKQYDYMLQILKWISAQDKYF